MLFYLSLALITFLIGVAVGFLLMRVFALFPAFLVVTAVIVAAGIEAGTNVSELMLAAAIAVVCIQIGYLTGWAIYEFLFRL